jgi:hypothetical protein
MKSALDNLVLARVFRRANKQHPSNPETVVHEVRLRIHDHMTTDTMCARYPPDQQQIIRGPLERFVHHPSRALLIVAELQRRLRAFEIRSRIHQGPHCCCGATLSANDPAEIAWRHEKLHQRLSPMLPLGDTNRVRLVGQRSGDDFDDVPTAAHDAGCAVSVAGASTGAGIRATSVRTVSDGTAPDLIQYSSRSRFNSSVSGLVRGL